LWIKSKKGCKRTLISKYLVPNCKQKWTWGINKKQKLAKFLDIFIIASDPLILTKNPYIRENLSYFKRRAALRALSKFRTMVYNEYKHFCAGCGQSLYMGEEPIELHHIQGVRHKGKYTLENIQPLHRVCHQKVTALTRD
jgi:hypothetical protein